MIITRTPFRISFAGGGSDLDAFRSRECGMVLTTAINMYMYVTVKKAFGNSFRVSYSTTEMRDRIEDIEHPIVRECLLKLGITNALEIVSIADLPARSGMASSSSFTVGLLLALYAQTGRWVSAEQLARDACAIEIDRLKEPIGSQDQYITAHGGLQFIKFMPDGDVFVEPVICSTELKRELNRHLMLFHAGGARCTRDVLSRQNSNTQLNMNALRHLCDIATQMRIVLIQGRDLNAFGRLLDESWKVKKSLDAGISTDELDRIYETAIEAGALGGKLLGAGGAGFFLFYCEPHMQERLRSALSLPQVSFSFEPQGARVIYVGEDHW